MRSSTSSQNYDDTLSVCSHDRSWRSRAASRTRSHLHHSEPPTYLLALTESSFESRWRKMKLNEKHGVESLNATQTKRKNQKPQSAKSCSSKREQKLLIVTDYSSVHIASHIWFNAFVILKSQNLWIFYQNNCKNDSMRSREKMRSSYQMTPSSQLHSCSRRRYEARTADLFTRILICKFWMKVSW